MERTSCTLMHRCAFMITGPINSTSQNHACPGSAHPNHRFQNPSSFCSPALVLKAARPAHSMASPQCGLVSYRLLNSTWLASESEELCTYLAFHDTVALLLAATFFVRWCSRRPAAAAARPAVHLSALRAPVHECGVGGGRALRPLRMGRVLHRLHSSVTAARTDRHCRPHSEPSAWQRQTHGATLIQAEGVILA